MSNAIDISKVNNDALQQLDPATNLPDGGVSSTKAPSKVRNALTDIDLKRLDNMPYTGNALGAGSLTENPFEYDFQLKNAADNRELRAQEQGMGTVLANATGRLIGTTATKALGSFGFLGGAIGSIFTQDINTMTDNFFSVLMRDAEDSIKEALPIRKVNAYHDGNLWEQMATAGFWFDDVVDGAAFALSAYFTGSGYLGVSSKLGTYSGLARAFQASSYAAKTGKLMANGMKLAPKLTNLVKKADLVTMSLVQSVGEAAFEAKDMGDQIYQSYIPMIEAGRMTPEEAKRRSAEASKSVFKSNMGILGLSNMVFDSMVFDKFRGAFKLGKKTNVKWGKLGEDIKPLTKWQKTKTFGKNSLISAASEGLYEENAQHAVQEYFKELDEEGLSGQGKTWESFQNVVGGMVDNLSTTDGLKSIMLGAIIGIGPGGYSGLKEAKANNKKQRVMQSLVKGGLATVESDLSRYLKTVDEKDENGKPTGKTKIFVNDKGEYEYDTGKITKLMETEYSKYKTMVSLLKAINSGNDLMSGYISDDMAASKVFALADKGFSKQDIKNWFEYKQKETEEQYKKSKTESLIPGLRKDTQRYTDNIDKWYNLYKSITSNHAGLFDFGNDSAGILLKQNAVAAQFSEGVFQTYWRERKDDIKKELDKLDNDAFNKIFETSREETESPEGSEPFRTKDFEGDEYTKANMEEAKQWLIDRFGKEVGIIIHEGLIETEDGKKHFGEALEDAFLLSDAMEVGTEYHEAFHRVSLRYLTPSENTRMYAAARKKYAKETKDMSDEQLEEFLAEKFREFVMNKQAGIETPTSGSTTFFQKIWDIITKVFTGDSAIREEEVDALFTQIEEGKFKDFERRTKEKSIAERKKLLQEKDGEIEALLQESYETVKQLSNPKSDYYIAAKQAIEDKQAFIEKLIKEAKGKEREDKPEEKPIKIYNKDGSFSEVVSLTHEELVAKGYEFNDAASRAASRERKAKVKVYSKKLDKARTHNISIDPSKKDKNILHDTLEVRADLFDFVSIKEVIEKLLTDKKDVAADIKQYLKDADGEVTITFKNDVLETIQVKDLLDNVYTYQGKSLPKKGNGTNYTSTEYKQVLMHMIQNDPVLKNFLTEFNIPDVISNISEEYKNTTLTEAALAEAKNQIIEKYWKDASYDDVLADSLFEGLVSKSTDASILFIKGFYGGRVGYFNQSRGKLFFRPVTGVDEKDDYTGDVEYITDIGSGKTVSELNMSIAKDSPVSVEISDSGNTINIEGEVFQILHKDPISAIKKNEEGDPVEVVLYQNNKKVVLKNPMIVYKVATSILLNEMAADIIFEELLTDTDARFIKVTLDTGVYNVYRKDGIYIIHNAETGKELNYKSKEFKLVIGEVNKMSSSIAATLIKRNIQDINAINKEDLRNEIARTFEILSYPTPEEILAAADEEEVRRTREDSDPEASFEEGESLAALNKKLKTSDNKVEALKGAVEAKQALIPTIKNNEERDKLLAALRKDRESLKKEEKANKDLRDALNKDLQTELKLQNASLHEDLKNLESTAEALKEAIKETTALPDDARAKADTLAMLNNKLSQTNARIGRIREAIKGMQPQIKTTEERILNTLANTLASIKKIAEHLEKIYKELSTYNYSEEVEPNDFSREEVVFTERGVLTPQHAMSYVHYDEDRREFIVRNKGLESSLINKKGVVGDKIVVTVDLGDREDSTQAVIDFWDKRPELRQMFADGFTLENLSKLKEEAASSVDFGTDLDNIPLRMQYITTDGKSYTEGLYYHTSWTKPGLPVEIRVLEKTDPKLYKEKAEEHRVSVAVATRGVRIGMLEHIINEKPVVLSPSALSAGHINNVGEHQPLAELLRKIDSNRNLKDVRIEIVTDTHPNVQNENGHNLLSAGSIGNVFWITSDTANGEEIAIKLNPQKISEQHAEFALKLLTMIAEDPSAAGERYLGPESNGNDTVQGLLDFLLVTGAKNTSVAQPGFDLQSYLESKQLFLEGSVLHYGSEKLDLKTATAEERENVVEWMKTNKNYAISREKLNSSPTKEIKVFNLIFDPTKDNYTSFIIKEGLLYTDVDVYRDTKSITKNPAVLFPIASIPYTEIVPLDYTGEINVTVIPEVIQKGIEETEEEEEEEEEVTSNVIIKRKVKVKTAAFNMESLGSLSDINRLPAGSLIEYIVNNEEGTILVRKEIARVRKDSYGLSYLEFAEKVDNREAQNIINKLKKAGLETYTEDDALDKITDDNYTSVISLSFTSKAGNSNIIKKVTLTEKKDLKNRKTITGHFASIKVLLGDNVYPQDKSTADSISEVLGRIRSVKGYTKVLSYKETARISELYKYIKENFKDDTDIEGEEGTTPEPPTEPPTSPELNFETSSTILKEEWDKLSEEEQKKLDHPRWMHAYIRAGKPVPGVVPVNNGYDFKLFRKLVDKKYEKANMQEAIAWLEKTLGKKLAVQIVEGLIKIGGNKYAFGQVTRKAMVLSDEMEVGTHYHEAFHVVSILFMDEADRLAVYKDARKKYGLKDKTDKEVEEILAEKFREYILIRQAELAEDKYFKGKIKSFFRVLYDIVVRFFKRLNNKPQYDVESLFRSIEANRFRNSKVNPESSLSEDKAVNRLFKTGDTELKYVEDEGQVAEVTKYLFKELISSSLHSSGVSLSDTKALSRLSYPKLFSAIEKKALHIQTALSPLKSTIKIIKELNDDGTLEYAKSIYLPDYTGSKEDIVPALEQLLAADERRALLLTEVLANKKFYASELESFMYSLDIVTNRDDLDLDYNETIEKDEEMGDELSNMATWNDVMFKYNAKDSVAANIKLLMSVLPSSFEMNEVTGFNTFEDFSVMWSRVMYDLQGHMETAASMMQALESKATASPAYAQLVAVLKTDQTLQTQFFRAFDKTINSYVKAIVNKEDVTSKNTDYITKLRFIDTNVYGEVNSRVQRWSGAFALSSPMFKRELGEKAVGDAEAFDQNAEVFYALKESYEKKNKVGSFIPMTNMLQFKNDILRVLGKLGIGIKLSELDATLSHLDQDPVKGMQKFLDFIEPIFSKRSSVRGILVNPKEYYNEGKTHKYNIFRKKGPVLNLATLLTNSIKSDLGFTMIGAEGNRYQAVTQNTYESDVIRKLKSKNTELLKNRLSAVYNKNSRILRRLAEDPEFADKFGIRALSAFAISDNDTGREFHNITEAEEYLLRINSMLNGYILFPTPADRKFTHFFEGLDVIKASLDESGNVSLATASELIPYLDDEINRVNLTRKQVRDAIAGKSVNLVEDLHYETVYKGYKVAKGDVVLVDGTLAKIGSKLPSKGILLKRKGKFVGNGTQFTHFKGYKTKLDKAEFIQSILNERLAEELETAAKLGIITTTGENKIIDPEIIEDYKGVDRANTTVEATAVKLLLLDNMMNSIMASVEMHKVFIGDPAQFATSEVLLKRIPLYTSTGDNTRNDFPASYFPGDRLVHSKQYNTVTVDDVYFSSKFYEPLVEAHAKFYLNNGLFDTIEEATKQAEIKLSSLKKANRTDGQTFLTPEMYRAILIKMGMFTSEIEEAYNLMLKEDDTLTEEEYEKISGVFLQPLKMLYLNTKTTGLQSYTIMDKMSMAVLFPRMVKGTQLEQVLKDMRSSGIDQLKFKSAQKVGNTKTGEFYAPGYDNKFTNSFTYSHVVKQDFEYLRFQLETTPHNSALNLVGTQFKKVGISNVSLDKKYSNGEYGRDIVSRIHNSINVLSERGSHSFKVDMGFSKDLVLNDKNAFMEKLREEAKKAGLSSKEVESFKLNADGTAFHLELDARPGNRKWVQSRLLSMIKKSVIDLKLPGGMFIQMSDIGLRSVYFDDSLRVNDEEGYVEAKISINMFRDVIPEFKTKNHSERVAWLSRNPEYTAIAYRIPTQGMNSEYTIKIVDFLEAEIGDVVVLAGEGPTIGGFDFDIDKLYILRPHYSKGGNPVEFLTDENSTSEDRYIKWVWDRSDRRATKNIRKLKTANINRIRDSYRKKIEAVKDEEYANLQRELDRTSSAFSEEFKNASEDFKKSETGIAMDEQFKFGEAAFKSLSQPVRDLFFDEETALYFKGLKGAAKTIAYKNFVVELQERSDLSRRDMDTLKILELTYDSILEFYGFKAEDIQKFKDAAIEKSKQSKELSWEEFRANKAERNDENYVERDAKIREMELLAIEMVVENQELPSLAEFETWSIEEQNTRRAVENRLIKDYMTIYLDDNQIAFRTQPLDFGTNQVAALSAKIADLEGSITKFSNSPLGTLTPSYHVDVKSKYSLGSNLGKYALASAHYNLGQLLDIHLPIYLGIGNSKEVDGKTVTDLSQIYGVEEVLMDGTKTKMPISEWYSALIDGHVDLATNPFITHINLTDFTANVASLLVRSGVGLNTFRFLSQPALKQMSELAPYMNTEIGRNTRDPKGEVLDYYLKKLSEIVTKEGVISEEANMLLTSGSEYVISKEEIAELFNSEQMMEDIETSDKKLEDKDFVIRQIKMIHAFSFIDVQAEALKNAVLTSRVDTKKFGNDITSILVFNKRIREAKLAEASGEGVVNYSRLYSETLLKGYTEYGVGLSLEALKHLLIEATPAYEALITEVLQNTNRFTKLKASDINRINNDTQAIIYSAFFTHNYNKKADGTAGISTKKIKDMIVGDNSMPTKIFKIQSGEYLPELEDNPLIKSFIPDFSNQNTPHSLKMLKPEDKMAKDKLMRAWEDMYLSANKEVRQFAIDLFEYSYVTTGFKQHAYSFFHLIPDSILIDSGYNSFIKARIADLQDASILTDSRFMDEIYLNNWNNDILVPVLKKERNDFMGISRDYSNIGVLTTSDNRFKIGLSATGIPLYKKYVKSTDGTLYKYAGIATFSDEKEEAIYYAVDKKGFYQGANRVVEYWKGSSMFESNKVFGKEEDKNIKHYLNDDMIGNLLAATDVEGNKVIPDFVAFKQVSPDAGVDDLTTIKDAAAKRAAELASNSLSINDPIKNAYQPTVNADSYAEGLEFAITNPIFVSPATKKEWANREWSKSQEAVRKHFKAGIQYKGEHYKDTEEAFHAEVAKYVKKKGLKSRPNYKILHSIMVDIIKAKLVQYPEFTASIGKRGGLNYLAVLRHQPTKRNSYWETGGKDGFLRAFREAYASVAKSSPSGYTLQSGGAQGADTLWGTTGEKYGLKNIVHWWLPGKAAKPPAANTEFNNKEVIEEGKKRIAKAFKGLFGKTPKSIRNELLIRDWAQVYYSDAVFAVAEIGMPGDYWKHDMKSPEKERRKLIKQAVQGGTGYAVEMAIQLTKPVYVFNQVKTENFDIGWYTWDSSKGVFVSIATPKLTINFAGVGSRNVTKEGEGAIDQVFKESFGATIEIPTMDKEELYEGHRSFKENEDMYAAITQEAVDHIGEIDIYNYELSNFVRKIHKANNVGNKIFLHRAPATPSERLTIKESGEIDMYAANENNEFIIPDSSLNVPFIEYLNEIGAKYTIYYTGLSMRLQDYAKQKVKEPEQQFESSQKVKRVSYKKAIELHNKGEALFTIRVGVKNEKYIKGLTRHKHFGNPFTGSGVKGRIPIGRNDGSKEAVEAASRAYYDWIVLDKLPKGVKLSASDNLDLLERRRYIIRIIESGKLDEVPLGYMDKKINGAFYYSHADALADIIEKSKQLRKEKKKNTVEEPSKTPTALTTPKEPLNIYTDGSDAGKKGVLGYGISFEYKGKKYSKSAVVDPEEVKKKYNIENTVSNPTVELMAAVDALKAFANKPEHIVINYDFTGVEGWLAKGHKTTKPYTKALKEEGLKYIKSIEDAGGSVKFQWVKAHSGNKRNDAADKLASSREEHDTLQQVFEDNKGGVQVGRDNPTTVSTDNKFVFPDGTVVKTGDINLNTGQREALHAMATFSKGNGHDVFSLIGYAGTGKSTVINIFKEYLKKASSKPIEFATPTHRANNVLLLKGVKGSFTLHSLLGLSPGVNLKDFNPRDPKFVPKHNNHIPRNGLVIIDESSMINDDLFDHITKIAKSSGTRIIFVGDDAQLKPVRQDNLSKALTSTRKRAVLDKVMRTGDNPLLAESMRLRQEDRDRNFSYITDKNEKGEGVTFSNNPTNFINKLVELFKSDAFKNDIFFARAVTFTNKSTDKINNAVRNRLWGEDALNEYNVGELLMGQENFEELTAEDLGMGRAPLAIKNGVDMVVKRVTQGKAEVAGVLLDGHDLIIATKTLDENDNVVEREKSIFVVSELLNNSTMLDYFAAEIQKRLDAALSIKNNKKARGAAFSRYYDLKDSFITSFDLIHPETGEVVKEATLKYGYSHTTHKSQGGTYTYTFINGDDINSAREKELREQLRYVAMTRSEVHSVVYSKHGDANEIDLSSGEAKFYTPMEKLAKEGEEVKEKCASPGITKGGKWSKA